MKIKLTFKIWVLIFFLALSLVAIFGIPPKFLEKGILIKSIDTDSPSFNAGLSKGEIIKEINSQPIKDIEDYNQIMQGIVVNPITFQVMTNKGSFSYDSTTLDFDISDNLTIINSSDNALRAGLLNNQIIIKINDYNITSKEDFNNAKQNLEPKITLFITTNKNKEGYKIPVNSPLDITVGKVPSTNLKTGLDLQGGARGLINPEKKLTSSEMADLIAVSKERLNVYGISDINIREATDLSGNKYMLVEVAGATPQDLRELIGKQGKFEAKIGNKTVFIGGKQDLTYVCRTGDCAIIRECYPAEGGHYCKFEFSVSLSPEAAKKQADATANLAENISNEERSYLNETLDLYLDDKLVDSLQIAADLKGKVVTEGITISGPGYGKTQAEAITSAQMNMNKLQTILITGSLPFKLEIVKLDSISPLLGKEFMQSIFYASAIAIIAVSLIVFLRYKKITLTLPIIFTMLSEIILILGFAAFIRWNLDIASIAGIIAAIGTGVDHQIIIVDESNLNKQYSWKERIKRAFFIIIGAFATTFFAMLPLWWAGAGLLRGFMVTIIIGLIVGVFIARPAFADIITNLME